MNIIILLFLILSLLLINNKEINCKLPSLDNPYMNYNLNNNNLSACLPSSIVKNLSNYYFRKDITPSDNIWGKYISSRQYYTMPNTNIVNKQSLFSKWCYSIPIDNCKLTGNNCIKYYDTKYNR